MNTVKTANKNIRPINSGFTEEKTRNFTVDAFRLFGAVSVVILHTIFYGDLPHTVVFLLKNLTRWAVPFFFLISGYYFAKPFSVQPNEAILKRLKYLIGIFISSNLIFYFVNIYTETPFLTNLSILSLVSGAHFHLWFIGSMIFGYLIVWFILEQNPQQRTILTIIVPLILFILSTGSYAHLLGIEGADLQYSRYIISVPLLLTGYYFSRYNILKHVRVPVAMLLVLFGVGLQATEAFALFKLFSISPISHDFLIGTYIFSIGMFFLSIKIVTHNEGFFTGLGRDYSLVVYLYHPIFFISEYTNFFFLSGDYYLSWLKPISILIICFVLIIILQRIWPLAFRFLNGTMWK